MLRSHYRSPIEVTASTIADAERALLRLDGLARRFGLAALAGGKLEEKSDFSWTGKALDLYERVAAVLDDDLDTPLAVALLFEALSSANSLADEGNEIGAREVAFAVNALFGALGLALVSSSAVVDEASRALVAQRDQARTAKNWAEADRLREELTGLGWTVEDSGAGTQIRRP